MLSQPWCASAAGFHRCAR